MRTRRAVRISLGSVLLFAGVPAVAGAGGALMLSQATAGAAGCTAAGNTGLTAAKVITASITGTTITAAGCDIGIYVKPGSSTIVINKVIVTKANDHGILVQDATKVTISTSTVKTNGVTPTKGIDENKAIELVGTSTSTVTKNTVTGNLADGGIGVADDGTTTDPGAPTHDTAPHMAKNDTVSTNTVTGNYSGCGIVYAAYNKGTTAGITGGTVTGNTVTGAPGKFGPHGPVVGGVVVAADTPGAHVKGVRVTHNTITGAGIPGVVVHSNAPGDAVSNITITANTLEADDWLSTDGPPVPGGIVVAASNIPPPVGPTLSGTKVTGNTISDEFYGIWLAGATASTTSPNTTTTTPGGQAVYVVPAAGSGYWTTASDGGVFSFGTAKFYGSMGGKHLNAPVVGMAQTLDQGGYWLAASDGGVFSFGDATFYGSMGGKPLNAPVVGIAATPVESVTPPATPTPAGKGYWLVASDGGIFTFGDATFAGSMGGKPLNAPVVGMAPTPSGHGYWEVAADGGVFSFGDANFAGSMGGKHLNAPMVGMAAMPDGKGYWLVAADGGVFSFGTAQYYGSEGGKPLNAPIVGIVASPTGKGYWLIGADGGIFAFGDATFYGSEGGKPLNAPMVGGAPVGTTGTA